MVEEPVTYREMVGYVNAEIQQMHQVRAESLIQINNTLEKMEVEQRTHEAWHRDVLQGYMDRLAQNKTAVAAILVSIIALLTNTVLGVIILLGK